MALRLAVDEARDYTHLRALLAAAYRDADLDPLAQRLAQQLALAELAGYLSIVAGYPAEVRPLLMNAGSIWRTPGVFKRAVAWFRDKVDAATSVPVQYEMAERAAARAVASGAAAHLDTAARLMKHAASRAAHGAELDATKTELRRALEDLGLTPGGSPLVESVPLREELQKTLARTRTDVLSVDFYQAAYPYWRYTSVLDTQTTVGCRALNRLTMPSKDPRWKGLLPPRHWKCRAHIEAVVHDEGVRAAKDEPPPGHEGEGEFGSINQNWEPIPGNYPADLFAIYRKQVGGEYSHVEVPGPWWRKDYKPGDWKD